MEGEVCKFYALADTSDSNRQSECLDNYENDQAMY